MDKASNLLQLIHQASLDLTGQVITTTRLDAGESATLNDPLEKVVLDGPAIITMGKVTINAPAGQHLAVVSPEQPLVIVAERDRTTMTKIRLPAATGKGAQKEQTGPVSEMEELGPYKMKNYDEKRFPPGKTFYYDGDHFRGEGETIVLKDNGLHALLKEWFDDDGEANGELRIGSALTVVEFRNEKQRLYGALVEHRLRRKGDTFQIAHKRVDLVNSEGELDGIAILL